jgi:hypothetical protein
MRIVRNIGYVKRQRKRARLSAVFGFIALVGTFPFAFIYSGRPAYVIGTYMMLLGGFVLFNHGMQQIGKWSNTPRHVREDLALDNHLNDLSDRHVLVHYGRPEKDVIDHVLVHPGGVLVITTRDFPGSASVENDVWRRKGSLLSRAFMISGPQIGNPTRDTDNAMAMMEKILTEADIEAEIQSAIVFTSQAVQLEVNGSTHPVLPVEELADYVRELEPDPQLTTSDREAIIALMSKGEELELPQTTRTRRPVKVKRRAA